MDSGNLLMCLILLSTLLLLGISPEAKSDEMLKKKHFNCACDLFIFGVKQIQVTLGVVGKNTESPKEVCDRLCNLVGQIVENDGQSMLTSKALSMDVRTTMILSRTEMVMFLIQMVVTLVIAMCLIFELIFVMRIANQADGLRMSARAVIVI